LRSDTKSHHVQLQLYGTRTYRILYSREEPPPLVVVVVVAIVPGATARSCGRRWAADHAHGVDDRALLHREELDEDEGGEHEDRHGGAAHDRREAKLHQPRDPPAPARHDAHAQPGAHALAPEQIDGAMRAHLACVAADEPVAVALMVPSGCKWRILNFGAAWGGLLRPRRAGKTGRTACFNQLWHVP
jgi:hypothetical protein